MNLLKSIFSKKDETIKSNDDFWNWFQKNERVFFNAVKQRDNIERDFFDRLSPKLAEIKEGLYFLTGMLNSDTVELVLTADGNIKNIPFVEELVNSAPAIKGWLFTALKPALDIKKVSIKMAGYEFTDKNLFFYPEEDKHQPDEIDITIVYDDFIENDKKTVTNGSYIFLDNFLGELNLATTVDNLTVIGRNNAEKELIPIEKLKDYLIWREKEFIEKYDGIRHHTDEDSYAMLEAELENGNALLAIINTELLKWDSKASHPWILEVAIKYGGEGNNGMPDSATYDLLNAIENDIMEELKDFDGYLNIGRETADGVREIYFACNDFRKPSMVLHNIQQLYLKKLDISYEIYKDKYWKSFDRFVVS